MYLYRFAMKKLPFSLTPDTEFFCSLPSHIEALNVLTFALKSGEALIKIVGEVGTGKTMLCRLVINKLEKSRKVAYIPYPKLSARELKFSLAKELGLRITDNCREDQLTQRIQTRLINLNKKYGPVILLIDEAQQLDKEGLETLRLFTNIETENHKLLQIVLFGQPELNKTLNEPDVRQIKQRIVFSYHLKPLTLIQTKNYVNQRLKTASEKKIHYGMVANWLTHYYSKGIPRLVNILCHKALMLAFGQNKQTISAINILRAAKDTESISTWILDHLPRLFLLTTLLVSGSAMAFWSMI